MNKSRIIRNTFYAQLAVFVLASLTSSVGSLVDGVIIGQFLGLDSIAAFGIITPLMITFSVFGAVLSGGSRNRFTAFLGQGKVTQAQAIFSLSCILSVGMAALLMIVILSFAGPIAAMLGASDNAANLLPKAKDYLIGIAFGLPAMNAVRTLNSYMAIDNDRNLPVLSSIAITVTDIILDFVVVLVIHGDTLEMGLATSISYYAALAVLLTHFRKPNIVLRFSLCHIPWRETGAIVVQGMPAGVCRIGNTLRSSFMNVFLAAIASSAAIAAYSVHRQADSFLNPVTIGMADTVAMLAAVIRSEEDRPAMKRLLFTSVQATLVITLGISVLSWLLAPQFAALYVKDSPEALQLSIRAVRCYALGMPLYGMNLIYQNYFQGIGKSGLSMASGFLMECGFLMLSAWVMSHWFGADAVWFAFPVTQVLMFVYYSIVIAVESRRVGIQQEGLWNRVLLLPDTFDVSDDDRLDCTVTTMEQTMELSQTVWRFCEDHGCEHRRTYMLSLAVEEMAGNVIEHGFHTDQKNHSIDVRIVYKGDDYILRIRDDCLIFDPVKQLELYSDADPVHHLGLRMVAKTSTEMRYTCLLNLNNLVVRV